jgi:adenylylsulfate kinase-like enzyme
VNVGSKLLIALSRDVDGLCDRALAGRAGHAYGLADRYGAGPREERSGLL